MKRNPTKTQAGADQLHNVRYKPADRVKPGLVLVEDFCDQAGKPLINAGTVLTEALIVRLNSMQDNSGKKVRLWVGERASS